MTHEVKWSRQASEYICRMRSGQIGHVETSTIRRASTVTAEHNVPALERVLAPVENEQIVTVVLTGPTGTGKSSLIAKLTNDRTIEIGDGINEQTFGVCTCGPYSLRELRSLWGLSNEGQHDCKVCFFDTQGFDGHTIGGSDEDRLIMSMLLCPYLAASNLCVLMHPGGLERNSVDSFVSIMESATSIRSELNSMRQTEDAMDIIDVVTRVSQYEIGRDEEGRQLTERYQPNVRPDSFSLASEYIKRVTEARLRGFSARHYFPLPAFYGGDVFDQGESFQAGFRLVAVKLLELIDISQSRHYLDGHGFVEMFRTYESSVKKRNFPELAAIARKTAQRAAVERRLDRKSQAIFQKIYKPRIDGYYSELTSAMDRRLAPFNVSFSRDGPSPASEIAQIPAFLLIRPEFPSDQFFWITAAPADKMMSSKVVKSLENYSPDIVRRKSMQFSAFVKRYRAEKEKQFLSRFDTLRIEWIVYWYEDKLKTCLSGIFMGQCACRTVEEAQSICFSFTEKYLDCASRLFELDARARQTAKGRVYGLAGVVASSDALTRRLQEEKETPVCNTS